MIHTRLKLIDWSGDGIVYIQYGEGSSPSCISRYSRIHDAEKPYAVRGREMEREHSQKQCLVELLSWGPQLACKGDDWTRRDG